MSTNTANFATDPNGHGPSLIQTGLNPHRYDDMLHLERPISKQHPPMSAANRAAQFAPFAALTGYHETVKNAEDQQSML